MLPDIVGFDALADAHVRALWTPQPATRPSPLLLLLLSPPSHSVRGKLGLQAPLSKASGAPPPGGARGAPEHEPHGGPSATPVTLRAAHSADGKSTGPRCLISRARQRREAHDRARSSILGHSFALWEPISADGKPSGPRCHINRGRHRREARDRARSPISGVRRRRKVAIHDRPGRRRLEARDRARSSSLGWGAAWRRATYTRSTDTSTSDRRTQLVSRSPRGKRG